MPKIKVPRKNPVVDMTAMCDVSFLLLTFFILTAKFKPQALVAVDVPMARTTTAVDNVFTIILNNEGKAYIALKESKVRYAMLQQMAEHYGDSYPQTKGLTEDQKKYFSLVDTWGTPMADLPRVLSMNGTQLKHYQEKEMPGIPYDSLKNELGSWVMAARYATDGDIKIGIKGDKNADVKYVKGIIKSLTDKDIHRFILITTLAAPAKEGEGAAPADAPKP